MTRREKVLDARFESEVGVKSDRLRMACFPDSVIGAGLSEVGREKLIEWGESDEIASLSLAAMVVTDNARFVAAWAR